MPLAFQLPKNLPLNDPVACAKLLERIEFEEFKAEKRIEKEWEGNKLLYLPRPLEWHQAEGTGYKGPNPKQQLILDAWKDRSIKVFTFTGGNRSGKTAIEVWMAFSVMFGEFIWSGEKLWFPHNKPRKVRLVGQDWDKHVKTVIEPALNEWWPQCRKVDKKKNNVGVEALWTDVRTKSTLEIMSNGQESDLHEGWFGDFICYDEPPKRDIRIANARGLVDRQGREFFCMTLLKEAWVDREVIKARNPDGTPDRSVFNVHAEIYDNVGYGLTIEGVDQFAKTLKDDEKETRLKGVPSYMHGIVLTNFRRERNIIPRIKKIPLDWIIDVAIDFHPSKPWDVLFRAVDSRNFHYLIDEIHEHGSWKTVGEDIVRTLKRYGCRVNIIMIDPLAKGDAQSDLDGESVFDKLSTLFAAYGYYLRTASKDKENGIVMLNDLLYTQNEMPALFVFDDLKVAPQQMEDWMYDETGKPSKVDDDMVENLYRLVLLGTQYTPPRDEDEYESNRRRTNGNNGRNRITGY